VRYAWLLAVVLAGCGGPAVTARDESGRVVAEAGLPADGRFALTYTHSVYKAPAEERFRATATGFVLDSVASPDPAVIDYYDLDGVRTHEGSLWVMRPAHPARFDRMPLAATRRGKRTLVVDGKRMPLYGHAVHLQLAVER
jgi:hypothetical protein